MQPYKEHFVIIGGTACDIQLTGSAMTPRATDDIDIIVVIEKLTEDFVRAIWQFVKDGNYKAEKRLSQQGQSVYALYRFTLQDEQLDYPQKIELLSRHSDLLGEPSGFHIEPIPTDEDSHSLSAIIMDDDYYDFTIHHTDVIEGLLVANNKALIVLKANAYLNLLKEREAGRHVNSKDICKHRSDVLKLVAAGSYPDPQPVNSKICFRKPTTKCETTSLTAKRKSSAWSKRFSSHRNNLPNMQKWYIFERFVFAYLQKM